MGKSYSKGFPPVKNETVQEIEILANKLAYYRAKNSEKEAIYEARSNDLPHALKSSSEKERALEGVTGWGEIVVETMVELITSKGVKAPETVDPQIQKVYRQNNLKTELKKMVREAAIFGTSYILLGYGDTAVGEPEIMITVESPKNCIGFKDPRTGRLDSFMKVVPDARVADKILGVYYTSSEIVYFEAYGSNLSEISREKNDLGFVPALIVDWQARPSQEGGQSEISRAVRSAYAMACDVLADMRRSGKIYATPTRYLINIDPGKFKDADGNAKGLETYMDSVWLLGGRKSERGSSAPDPKVGQFQPASPQPFIELYKVAGLNVAAVIGAEPEEFGFPGNQPAAGDALIVRRERRIKRAEERMLAMDPILVEMYKYALLMLGEALPEDIDELRPVWETPQPATPSATADAIGKLIQAGVIFPESEAAARMVGLSAADVAENKALRKAKERANIVTNILSAGTAAQNANPVIKQSSEVNNATESQDATSG